MATIPHVPTTPDPILAAIERHRAAFDAFRDAPSFATSDDYDAATDALVVTPCETRFGALALLIYLRWWLDEEAAFAAGHQPAYAVASARLADLKLFLGSEPPPSVAARRALPLRPEPHRIVRRLSPTSLDRAEFAAIPPDEVLPGSLAPWQAVSAIRPDTAFCRAPRFLDAAGELLAALLIIGGGMGLIGLATLA